MKKNVIFFALAATLMLPATGLKAQNERGGLFGQGPQSESSKQTSMLNRQGTDATLGIGGAGNQPFGVEPDAPLGSGVVMLIAAGAGYALLKKKEQK